METTDAKTEAQRIRWENIQKRKAALDEIMEPRKARLEGLMKERISPAMNIRHQAPDAKKTRRKISEASRRRNRND